MDHVTFLASLDGRPCRSSTVCTVSLASFSSSTRTTLDQCTCRARGFDGSHDFDRVTFSRGFQESSPVMPLSVLK